MTATLSTPLSRRTALRRLGGGGLAAALAARGLLSAAAQDTTPTAAGVTVEVLGSGLPAAAPGRTLTLARVTFAPGFTLAAHTHPGTLVGHFESGAFGFRVLEGESARVVRAGGPGTPAATDPIAGESVPPGTEVIINPGDVLFHDEDVVAVDRNAGDGPVVFLAAVLFRVDQPFLEFV